MSWFGVSKMTPSWSRVVQLQLKTAFKSNCETRLLWGIFYARLSQGTTTRGRMTLTSTVLECGPINGVLCTGNSREFKDFHGKLLSTSTPYPQKNPEFESPEYCTRFNTLPSDLAMNSSTPTSNTGALQVKCRSSSNLRCSRKR